MEAVQYLVAECNYGGRITDTHDRRLLCTLLQRLVSLKVASDRGCDLAETAGLYPVPVELSRLNVIETIKRMQVVPHPEGLGLSVNSAVVRDSRDSKRLLQGVLLTQPGVAEEAEVAAEGRDATKAMMQRVRKLKEKVPKLFDLEVCTFSNTMSIQGARGRLI